MPDLHVAARPFADILLGLWRALDDRGLWRGHDDRQILQLYVVDRSRRVRLPPGGLHDPATQWRIDLFHNAICTGIEERTGVLVSPVIRLQCEGIGRAVLVAGRLAVYDRHLREAHRFGFDGIDRLLAEGEEGIADAVALIERFPDAAGG